MSIRISNSNEKLIKLYGKRNKLKKAFKIPKQVNKNGKKRTTRLWQNLLKLAKRAKKKETKNCNTFNVSVEGNEAEWWLVVAWLVSLLLLANHVEDYVARAKYPRVCKVRSLVHFV